MDQPIARHRVWLVASFWRALVRPLLFPLLAWQDAQQRARAPASRSPGSSPSQARTRRGGNARSHVGTGGIRRRDLAGTGPRTGRVPASSRAGGEARLSVRGKRARWIAFTTVVTSRPSRAARVALVASSSLCAQTASRASHLDETAAADIALSQDDRRRIDEILSAAAPVVGPSPEGM